MLKNKIKTKKRKEKRIEEEDDDDTQSRWKSILPRRTFIKIYCENIQRTNNVELMMIEIIRC